jgi:hypothetical protein
MVTARCECGHAVQVPAERAGQTFRCPACGVKVRVPGGKPKSEPEEDDDTVQTLANARRPVLEVVEEVVELEPAEPERPRRRRSGSWLGGKRLWFAVGGGVVLLLGAGLTAWLIWGGSTPPDLQLVPSDAAGFTSLRVADVWNSDTIKKILQKLPPDAKGMTQEMEKRTGLAPADVERVTVVWREPKPEPDYMIVATLKPYDRTKVVEMGFGSKPQESKVGNRSYFVNAAASGLTVAPITERVFVMGEEPGVKKCLEQPERKKAEGPLAEALTLAAAGKHHLVMAVRAQPKLKEMAGTDKIDVKAVAEFQSVTVLGTLGDALDTEVRLAYADEPGAVAARKNVEALKGFALTTLPGFRDRWGKSTVDQLREVLDGAKIEQKGTGVTLSARLDLPALVSAGMDAFLGGGPPQ